MTLRLRELERDDVISRTVYPEVRPRVEYALTELGRGPGPMLGAMSDGQRDYSEIRGRAPATSSAALAQAARGRPADAK